MTWIVPGRQHAPRATRQHRDVRPVVDREHPQHDRRLARRAARVGCRRHARQRRRTASTNAAMTPRPAATARSRRRRRPPARAPRRPRNRGRWRAPRHPSPHRLQHARHPERSVGGDLERIDGRVLQPPVEHVDRLQPVERAQPHAPLADDQVGALDEVHAELHREVRVVDVRRMVETAGEDDDTRARLGRRGRQRPPHRARVAGDRGDLVVRHHVGNDSRHHRPVEQRVPDPGRRVGEVLHDVPRAVVAEHEIDGIRRQPTSGRGTDGVDAVAIGRRQAPPPARRDLRPASASRTGHR